MLHAVKTLILDLIKQAHNTLKMGNQSCICLQFSISVWLTIQKTMAIRIFVTKLY